MPSRAKTALLGAGTGTALLVLVWLLAFHTGIGAHADRSIFAGFTDLQRPRVNGLAGWIRDLCNTEQFVVLGAALIAVALLRRRRRVAVAIGALLLGSTATTELLKPLLASPRALSGHPWLLPPASWPSGHATAAMSLALALVLAVPSRRRALAAVLGAGFAVAVSCSFLTLGSHYPSDVLGGFLVAVIWAQLTVAGLLISDARWQPAPARERRQVPVPVRHALRPAAWAVACASAVALAAVLARPHAVLSYVTGHAAFAAGASAIGALALALATALMLTVRR
jgi:membrane-associated phospholipid phosphatase